MSFMEPQITWDEWYKIDGPMGTEWVPSTAPGVIIPSDLNPNNEPRLVPEALDDYCENLTYWTLECVKGYGACLSAPGYMDCTDWCVFDTEKEASEYLQETYDLDENLEPITEEF